MLKNIFRRENIGFSGLQWFFLSGTSTIIAFMVVFLDNAGYSESQIGIVMSALSIGSVLGQPFWGYVSDKRNAIRNVIVFTLLISGISMLFVPVAVNYFVLIFFLVFVMSFTENSMHPIIDSWTFSHIAKKPWIDYGLTRGLGSLGYAVTAFFFGFIIQRFGYNLIFYVHFLIILISISFAFFIEPKEQKIITDTGEDKLKFSFSDVNKKDLAKFIIFLISTILIFTGYRANATFFPILLKERGGDVSMVGIAYFIMAGSEFPVLFFGNKFLKKYKDTSVIMVAMLFFILRIFLNMSITSPYILLSVQFTQGLSFAVFLPAAINYIRRLAPLGKASTFLTIATSAFLGVGGILGSYIGGIVTENFGVIRMLNGSLVLTIIGVLIFAVTSVRKSA